MKVYISQIPLCILLGLWSISADGTNLMNRSRIGQEQRGETLEPPGSQVSSGYGSENRGEYENGALNNYGNVDSVDVDSDDSGDDMALLESDPQGKATAHAEGDKARRIQEHINKKVAAGSAKGREQLHNEMLEELRKDPRYVNARKTNNADAERRAARISEWSSSRPEKKHVTSEVNPARQNYEKVLEELQKDPRYIKRGAETGESQIGRKRKSHEESESKSKKIRK